MPARNSLLVRKLDRKRQLFELCSCDGFLVCLSKANQTVVTEMSLSAHRCKMRHDRVGFLFSGLLLLPLQLFEMKQAMNGQAWNQREGKALVELLLRFRQTLEPQPNLLTGGAVVNPEAFACVVIVLWKKLSLEVRGEKLFS